MLTSRSAPKLRGPRRVEALLALIPAGCAVADIGYDHGLLLEALLRRGEQRLIGVELRAGADEELRQRLELRGQNWTGRSWSERLELRRGSGFDALRAGEVELAVLAGLGERTLLRLVRRGAELGRLPPRLILAPAGPETLLRPSLAELGWRVASSRLACQAGRFHELLALEPGQCEAEDELELRFGREVFQRPDPLFPAFLDDLARRSGDALARLAELRRQGRPPSSPGLAKLALLDAARRRFDAVVTSPSGLRPERA